MLLNLKILFWEGLNGLHKIASGTHDTEKDKELY